MAAPKPLDTTLLVAPVASGRPQARLWGPIRAGLSEEPAIRASGQLPM